MKRQFSIFALAGIVVFALSSCKKDQVDTFDPATCAGPVSFATDVLPIIQNNCTGCHGQGNGTGYVLTNYTNVKQHIDAVIGSMKGQGYKLMPQGGPKLPDSTIKVLQCWKAQGLQDN